MRSWGGALLGYVRRHHVALLALFIALGGTSYGLARNSIDSREIRDNDVRTRDLRNNDVRSRDVRDRSLLARDFARGQLPAGPQGATGQRGATGPPAASFLTGQVPQNQMPNIDGASLTNLAPSGLSVTTGVDDLRMLSPNQTIVLRDLAVRLSVAPGVGADRTFLVGVARQNQLPSPAIGCSIVGNATECASTGTATIPPRSILTFSVTNGPGDPPAPANAKFGYRATIP